MNNLVQCSSENGLLIISLLVSWAVINFFQILFLFFVAKKKNLLQEKHETQVVYFLDDYFFVIWNTFCSIACLYYAYFLYLNPCDSGLSIFQHSEIKVSPFKNIFHFFVYSDIKNIEYMGYIVLVALSVATQIKNHERKIKYWWYASKCKVCSWIRLLFLVVNVYVIALISWKLVIFSFQIYILSNEATPTIQILHMDKFGGMGTLGHMIIVSSSIFILRSIVGLAGIFDHTRGRKISATYIAGDIYNLFYGIYAFVGFIVFSLFASKLVNSEKAELVSQIDKECGIINSAAFNNISCGPELLQVRTFISQVSSFPFPLKDLGLIIFAALLPIASGKLIGVTRKRVIENSDENWV